MPPSPSTPSDNDLLRQLHGGSSAAFDSLYRRHQGALFRFCLMRSGSSEIAADVVQEVFMGLLTNAFRFDPLRGSLPNFLFGVARNLVMKQDKPTAHPPFDDDGENEEDAAVCPAPSPLDRLLRNEQAEQVRQALAALPPHHRDVLILFELHDRSYVDIAAICQLDIGTVRSRLSRARAALAKRLTAWRAIEAASTIA